MILGDSGTCESLSPLFMVVDRWSTSIDARQFDYQIRNGIGRAGVDIAILFICGPPSVRNLRDIYLSADQTAVAVSAFTASAVGGRRNSSPLDGHQM